MGLCFPGCSYDWVSVGAPGEPNQSDHKVQGNMSHWRPVNPLSFLNAKYVPGTPPGWG